MILIATVAEIIAGDREKGFLSRMFTTPARPSDFILGYSLPFIPVLIVSAPVYLGVGMALGFTVCRQSWACLPHFASYRALHHRDRHDSGQPDQERVSGGDFLVLYRSHGYDLRGLVHIGPNASGSQEHRRCTPLHSRDRRLPGCCQWLYPFRYHARHLLACRLDSRPICYRDCIIQKNDGELRLTPMEAVSCRLSIVLDRTSCHP